MEFTRWPCRAMILHFSGYCKIIIGHVCSCKPIRNQNIRYSKRGIVGEDFKRQVLPIVKRFV